MENLENIWNTQKDYKTHKRFVRESELYADGDYGEKEVEIDRGVRQG